jgi:hypothetical protein
VNIAIPHPALFFSLFDEFLLVGGDSAAAADASAVGAVTGNCDQDHNFGREGRSMIVGWMGYWYFFGCLS